MANAAPNRKMRRAAAKIERKTGGVLVDAAALDRAAMSERMLFAIVKDQGRIRISKATLEGLKATDRMTSKDDGVGGVVLSYVAAPTPNEARAAEPNDMHEGEPTP